MFITDSSHKLELPGSCSVFVEIPQWMCILESLQKCRKSVLQCSDWVLPWNLLIMYSCSLQVLHSLIAKLARFSLSSIFACNQGPRKMKLFSSFTVVKEELPKGLHLYLYQRRTCVGWLSAPSQVLLEDAWGQCTASAWCPDLLKTSQPCSTSKIFHLRDRRRKAGVGRTGLKLNWVLINFTS